MNSQFISARDDECNVVTCIAGNAVCLARLFSSVRISARVDECKVVICIAGNAVCLARLSSAVRSDQLAHLMNL